MIKIGGGYRIWTGDQGFADPCLTTWLSRLNLFNLMGRLRGIEPPNVGTTIRCVNHFATAAIFNNNIYYTFPSKLCQELFKIFFYNSFQNIFLIIILINNTFKYTCRFTMYILIFIYRLIFLLYYIDLIFYLSLNILLSSWYN